MQHHRSDMTIVGAASLAGGLFFVGAAALGWPGAASECLTNVVCYCEVPSSDSGWARQPINTWSNLPTLALAWRLAAAAARRRARRSDVADLLLVFAINLVFQAFAAAVFHGGLKVWGAVLDGISVLSTLGLLVATNLARIDVLPLARLGRAFLVAIGAGVVYRLVFSETTGEVGLYYLGAVVVGEIIARKRHGRPPGHWFALAGVSFASAAAAWGLSVYEGLPLCQPGSPIIGHAVWHVCAGVAVFSLAKHAEADLWRRNAGRNALR